MPIRPSAPPRSGRRANASTKGPLSPQLMAARHAQLQAWAQQFLKHMAAGDFAAAWQVNRQADALVPQHPQITGDGALCQMRMGHAEQALALYAKACALDPEESNWWDGRAEASGHLGRMSHVRQFGLRALALKDAAARQGPNAQPPLALQGAPPPLSQRADRNIIAFSLFGALPQYCETALLNVQAARELLPQWTCRFYLDDTVPEALRQRLHSAGAQVQRVSEVERAELSGLMWRFAVLQDPQVDRYLLRDADSLISTREAAAVHAWLHSGSWFHHMRDYFTHTELLMAGMWGGCGGVFLGVEQSMADFVRLGQYLGQRVVDQHYLRAHIWPTVRQSLLCHDSVFGFLQASDFPPHAPHPWGEDFHVGSHFSIASIGGQSALADGQSVHWRLCDDRGQAVCSYSTPVVSGQWRAALPKPYIAQIRSGAWRVEWL